MLNQILFRIMADTQCSNSPVSLRYKRNFTQYSSIPKSSVLTLKV